MRTRRAGLVGLVMSGVTLVAAGGAWACVPGMDHSGGGGGNPTGGPGAAGTPAAPVAPAAPGPEAAAAANGTALTPALPLVPPASSSPVTWTPAPAVATASSSGGSQTVVGVGLFVVGGILVVGGMAQMTRTRRPQRRLAPVGP